MALEEGLCSMIILLNGLLQLIVFLDRTNLRKFGAKIQAADINQYT